jgi:hypothetical protein
MTDVTVHIEELVLHGFDPRGRHALADALQEELGRLLGQTLAEALDMPPGGTTALRHVPALGAGPVDMPPGGGAAVAGTRLGAAVFESLAPLVAAARRGEGSGADRARTEAPGG